MAMIEADKMLRSLLGHGKVVCSGSTYASALLGSNHASKADAEQQDVGDESHCDDLLVLCCLV